MRRNSSSLCGGWRRSGPLIPPRRRRRSAKRNREPGATRTGKETKSIRRRRPQWAEEDDFPCRAYFTCLYLMPFRGRTFLRRWCILRRQHFLGRFRERLFHESRRYSSGKYRRALVLLNFQAVEKPFYVRI